MPTTRSTNREIVLEDIDLMRWDTDEDFLAYGDWDDETILASTGNATAWTKRGVVSTSWTKRTSI